MNRRHRDALRAIEEICVHEDVTGYLNQVIDKIYRIAHVALGTCKNPHFDWLAEFNACCKKGENEETD